MFNLDFHDTEIPLRLKYLIIKSIKFHRDRIVCCMNVQVFDFSPVFLSNTFVVVDTFPFSLKILYIHCANFLVCLEIRYIHFLQESVVCNYQVKIFTLT